MVGRRTAMARSYLTTRGALLGLLALNLLVFLLAAWLHVGVLAGIGYLAGAVLAPWYLRREAQLQVTVSVPAIALLAVIMTQALTAQGSSGHGSVISVFEGTFLTLAALAPWLLAGTAACLAIACCRGLPQCVRDLRAALRFEAGTRSGSVGSLTAQRLATGHRAAERQPARPANRRPANHRPAHQQPASHRPAGNRSGRLEPGPG